jgi:hypothetical protein
MNKKMIHLKGKIFLFSLLFCVGQSFSAQNEKCPNPYGQCNLGKYGMINVHIVPHTHDDVGYLIL